MRLPRLWVRAIAILLATLVLLALWVFVWADMWHEYGDTTSPAQLGSATPAKSTPPSTIENGQYLTRIGNCAACHTEAGTGDRTQGAPNLTDAIWLYGGTVDDLTYTINNARFGVMPNWNQRLSEADIRSVALYVHGLGGGE